MATQVLATAVVMAMSTGAALAADSVLLPPDESVEGASQAIWSQRWWEWAGSFPYELSPVADKTGDLCASNQSGEVWFLAGTYGTQRAIRTCHVPRDKYLFFPLINYLASAFEDRAGPCVDFMTSAAQLTRKPKALVLQVDGVRMEDLMAHRQASPACFDVGAKAFGSPRYRAAANGYYVMLRPLSPGRHTVEFGGALPTMYQAVTYTLIID
ncbi:hypothetical protein [Roseateles terrae]|uniref:Uncharacterized protein n=1 Tax=Roseateles terrae TaxID=431060 RepID=A0ABR6GP42_9BURK|nr:hypothetical protein [Roseateles terrae]MBB3193871.1 hypothetical protein [Roseateles terrae]